jgi:2,4-dienoyl-CoA reductase [(3E)-enoyl-CoA-producing], peroxisomal
MSDLFRPDLLKGKNVLITGGGSGIGLGIGKYLNGLGARIIILGRSLDRLTEAAKQFPPNQCLFFQCDVRKPDRVKTAVKETLLQVSKIDILINNAAGNFLAPFTGLSANAFRTVIEIDLLGTFNVSKEVVAQSMLASGGVIINISATLQMPATYMQAHASAAKAGIDSLTRSMAMELGPKGVRVNGIAPGATEGTEGTSRLNPDQKNAHNVADFLPVQRIGTIKDLAELAVLLIFNQNITGQTVVCDGGMTLSFPNFMLVEHEMFNGWRAKL